MTTYRALDIDPVTLELEKLGVILDTLRYHPGVNGGPVETTIDVALQLLGGAVQRLDCGDGEPTEAAARGSARENGAATRPVNVAELCRDLERIKAALGLLSRCPGIDGSEEESVIHWARSTLLDMLLRYYPREELAIEAGEVKPTTGYRPGDVHPSASGGGGA